MNFNIFKAKQKTPYDLVKHVKDAIHKLDGPDRRKAAEEVSKYLVLMKNILYGEDDHEPSPDIIAQLAQETYKADLLQLLILSIQKFEFETKKDVSQIFNNLLKRQIGSRWPTVEHLCAHEEILFHLLRGYEQPEIALNCGLILRECVRHEALAKIVLYSSKFYQFFEYVSMSTFDVASDAFASFKEVLTRHKSVVSDFMDANYDDFFDHYKKLLQSENYVTKRQSLKLLGEILLDRTNFTIMTRYISNADNLKLMMNLLRDRSKNIQFEAFHVFKVFVANPHKTKPIMDILVKNQEKLVYFLGNFHNERQDDEQFTDEKSFLIKQIQELQPIQD